MPTRRQAPTIRILIVDDHALFRRGVAVTLREAGGVEVAGEAATLAAALDACRRGCADVILLDLHLPDGSGLDAIPGLLAACPGVRILVLTVSETDAALLTALERGASGYLVKGISGTELLQAVRAVFAGESYISPGIAGKVLTGFVQAPHQDAGPIAALTAREREVLRCVARGLSNRQVGERLYLSESTVKHHMTSILQKLGVTNRVAAALLLRQAESSGGES